MFYFEIQTSLAKVEKQRSRPSLSSPAKQLKFLKVTLTLNTDQFILALNVEHKARISWLLLNIRVPFNLRMFQKLIYRPKPSNQLL
jgi:hypothetical protein